MHGGPGRVDTSFISLSERTLRRDQWRFGCGWTDRDFGVWKFDASEEKKAEIICAS